ncbi:MAG: hypothetical protein K9M07_07830 [Simkaniaceae bacterium]|nr:hypothetical protein [Simkaniaceae bacterium]
MRFFLWLLLFTSFSLGAVEAIKSPAEIQAELDQAQAEFDQAKKMFNPYFAGPLITGSAHNTPPGSFNIQPYLFLTDIYGAYSSNRKVISAPDFWQINPQFLFQTGITQWLDITLVPQGVYNNHKNAQAVYWSDMGITLGFQLLKETPYIPALRLTFTETFPTGRYERLNPAKFETDATGTGSFQSQLSLNISKVLWTFPLHPMQLRGNIIYNIPSNVSVSGFNTYGGGYGTSGTVSPGSTLQFDASIEVSIVQTWVFALDMIYKTFGATHFSGTNGIKTDGSVATNSLPSGDQFSLAPAIEYNPSERQQFIIGPWFTVTGRNSASFVSLVLSYEYNF